MLGLRILIKLVDLYLRVISSNKDYSKKFKPYMCVRTCVYVYLGMFNFKLQKAEKIPLFLQCHQESQMNLQASTDSFHLRMADYCYHSLEVIACWNKKIENKISFCRTVPLGQLLGVVYKLTRITSQLTCCLVDIRYQSFSSSFGSKLRSQQ